MSPTEPLDLSLHRVRRRLAARVWLQETLHALYLATGAGCLWLVLSRVFTQVPDAALALPVLWALALVWGGVQGLRKRPDLLRAALACDLHLGLKERFTSSLALRDEEGPMVAAVHADAAAHLTHLNPRMDFPLLVSRTHRRLLIPMVLFGAGYMLLPELDLFGQRERAAQAAVEAQALASKARSLQQAAQVLKPEEMKPEDPLRGIQTELEGLAEALAGQEITEKQALARVTKLSAELQAHREAMRARQPSPALAAGAGEPGLAQELARDLAAGQYAEVAQKLRGLQQKLQEGGQSAETVEEMKEALKVLEEKMGKTPEGDLGALLSALGQARSGLEAGDLAAAAAGLESGALSLEELAALLEHLAMVENSLGQLESWKQAALGPSKFCRSCGKKLGPCKDGGKCEAGECESGSCGGECAGGSCSSVGAMAGTGGLYAGSQRGTDREGSRAEERETPKPLIVPGQLVSGRLLTSIQQEGVPEQGGTASVAILGGDFQAVRQEAEMALTKEEIPAGSREFVRRYFGTLGAPDE